MFLLFEQELIIINGEGYRIICRINFALLFYLGLNLSLFDWLRLISLLSSTQVSCPNNILGESELLNSQLDIIFAVFFPEDREQLFLEE